MHSATVHLRTETACLSYTSGAPHAQWQACRMAPQKSASAHLWQRGKGHTTLAHMHILTRHTWHSTNDTFTRNASRLAYRCNMCDVCTTQRRTNYLCCAEPTKWETNWNTASVVLKPRQELTINDSFVYLSCFTKNKTVSTSRSRFELDTFLSLPRSLLLPLLSQQHRIDCIHKTNVWRFDLEGCRVRRRRLNDTTCICLYTK